MEYNDLGKNGEIVLYFHFYIHFVFPFEFNVQTSTFFSMREVHTIPRAHGWMEIWKCLWHNFYQSFAELVPPEYFTPTLIHTFFFFLVLIYSLNSLWKATNSFWMPWQKDQTQRNESSLKALEINSVSHIMKRVEMRMHHTRMPPTCTLYTLRCEVMKKL